MLKREKVSLNKISTDAACGLVRSALKKGVNIKKVFVDTVGKPEAYKLIFERAFPNSDIEFTVCPKADSIYPVVSAASIVAKVTRDRTINDWVFVEEDTKIDNKFGCGYPSDPITKKWMERNRDNVFGYPSIVRFSWKTCTNFLENKSIQFEWENFVDEESESNQSAVYKMGYNNLFNQQTKTKYNFLDNNSIQWSNINLFK